MSKSGVERAKLKDVWALADYGNTGQLDEDGFMRACRLIGVLQAKKELTPDAVLTKIYDFILMYK